VQHSGLAARPPPPTPHPRPLRPHRHGLGADAQVGVYLRGAERGAGQGWGTGKGGRQEGRRAWAAGGGSAACTRPRLPTLAHLLEHLPSGKGAVREGNVGSEQAGRAAALSAGSAAAAWPAPLSSPASPSSHLLETRSGESSPRPRPWTCRASTGRQEWGEGTACPGSTAASRTPARACRLAHTHTHPSPFPVPACPHLLDRLLGGATLGGHLFGGGARGRLAHGT
jgi:hypothetical protein